MKTSMEVIFPEGYRINRPNGKTWLGSSADGQVFILAERMASSERVIPYVLAEGEPGMFITSTRPAIEQIDASTFGIEACGEFGGRQMMAYLARVSVHDKLSYLVAAATENDINIDSLRDTALNIARRFVR